MVRGLGWKGFRDEAFDPRHAGTTAVRHAETVGEAMATQNVNIGTVPARWTFTDLYAPLTVVGDREKYRSGSAIPSTGSGVYVIPLPTGDVVNTLAVMVVAELSGDPAPDPGERFAIRVWGICRRGASGNNYNGSHLADFQPKIGTPSSDIEFPDMNTYNVHFCDNLRVDDDATLTPPGIRLMGDTDDSTGQLVFDPAGFEYIILEVGQGAYTTANLKVAIAYRGF